MDLEDNDIREFADLWQHEFGETLSPEQARHEASHLMELYALLARPSEWQEPKPVDAKYQTP